MTLFMSSFGTLGSQNTFFHFNVFFGFLNLLFLTYNTFEGACFSGKSVRLTLANLTHVTKDFANTTNGTDLVSSPSEYRQNQFELDIILSVYDENPGEILNHLESCCDVTSCRVFVYSSMAEGTSRSHELEHRTRENHELEDWMNTPTRYQKFGARVNNSWTGTESTGFLWHIAHEYDNYAAKVAFVHSHVSSWHSGRLCDIIKRGASDPSVTNGKSTYINLNNPYPRRCVSRTNAEGIHTSEELRDNIYENWTRWFGTQPPVRVTYECCAQFITTRDTLRNKPQSLWNHALSSMASSEWNIPWEYLWATLVNEDENVKKASC